MFAKGILCPVTIRNTAIKSAANTARYNASSPEETGMFRTKRPNVPNIVMDTTSIKRGFITFFIHVPLYLSIT